MQTNNKKYNAMIEKVIYIVAAILSVLVLMGFILSIYASETTQTGSIKRPPIEFVVPKNFDRPIGHPIKNLIKVEMRYVSEEVDTEPSEEENELPIDENIIPEIETTTMVAEPYAEKEESEMEYLGVYYITGYDPHCAHCCGKTDGITASGAQATPGYTVAMKDMPFGTKIYIEGLGIFEVQDRGVGSGKVDVACVDHSACYAITGSYEVWVWYE